MLPVTMVTLLHLNTMVAISLPSLDIVHTLVTLGLDTGDGGTITFSFLVSINCRQVPCDSGYHDNVTVAVRVRAWL